MSNSRIGADPCRIMKHNEQSTMPGRWAIDVPGPGTDAPYMEDPHVRVQKWAGNLRTHSMHLQNTFMRGLAQEPRDCITNKSIFKGGVNDISSPIFSTSSRGLTTEQSRAICPAWTLRGLEGDAWVEPVAPKNNMNPFMPTLDGRDLSKKEWVTQTAHNNGRQMRR